MRVVVCQSTLTDSSSMLLFCLRVCGNLTSVFFSWAALDLKPFSHKGISLVTDDCATCEVNWCRKTSQIYDDGKSHFVASGGCPHKTKLNENTTLDRWNLFYTPTSAAQVRPRYPAAPWCEAVCEWLSFGHFFRFARLYGSETGLLSDDSVRGTCAVLRGTS